MENHEAKKIENNQDDLFEVLWSNGMKQNAKEYL